MTNSNSSRRYLATTRPLVPLLLVLTGTASLRAQQASAPVENLRVSVASYGGRYSPHYSTELRTAGGFGAFGVSESEEGHTDLNGDGDDLDTNVVHVLDMTTGSVTNLGLAALEIVAEREPSGAIVVISVLEAEQGADLNGDGDLLDAVVHAHDCVTGETKNLGVAVAGVWNALSRTVLAEKTLVVFVSEYAQGNADLNGDGDANDFVLHACDVERDVTTNLRVSGADAVKIEDNRVAFVAWELGEGADLNGDGDADDKVLQLVDLRSNTVQNLGLAVPRTHRQQAACRGEHLVFKVSESEQGGIDLNGDGDASDRVLHDLESGVVTNLRLAGRALGGSDAHVLLGVFEDEQGATDLNGDGDALDDVLFELDLATLAVTNLRSSFDRQRRWGGKFERFVFSHDGAEVAVVVEEMAEGVDLNGDGDRNDDVLHVIELGGSGLHNVGFGVTEAPSLVARYVSFTVYEGIEGIDLNGDGDTRDRFAYFHDIRTGTTSTDGLAGSSAESMLDERWGLTQVSEYEHGDLNGDGDMLDEVLYVRDTERNTTTNLRVADFSGFTYSRGRAVFSVSEYRGRDLNGDGDRDDDVLFEWRAAIPSVVHNLGHAVDVYRGGGGAYPRITSSYGPRSWLHGDDVFFVVPEGADGNRRLNQDGDRRDFVLHRADLRTSTQPRSVR